MAEEKKKLSKKLHDKLKDIYPESTALDHDRQFTAEDTRPPTQENINVWARGDNKSRMDLSGFDNRSAREPSVTQIEKSLSDKKDYIHNEAKGGVASDKFITEKYDLGRRIASKQKQINDYNSFKDVVKKVWREAGLGEWVDSWRFTEKDYVALWNHPVIQNYVDTNTRPQLLNFIMRKYGVEPVKATKVLNRLNSSQRRKLFHKIRVSGLPRITAPKSRPQPKSRATVRKRRASSPRWSDEEVAFLRANANLPAERIFDAYNSSFDSRRSIDSVRNKLYRLKKKKRR